MPYEQSTRRRFLKRTTAGIGAFAIGGLGTGITAAQTASLAIAEVGTEIENANGPNDWNTVQFDSLFVDTLSQRNADAPIVTMKPASYRGKDPCHVRLRNVGAETFEWKIEEWDYLDERHKFEKLFWVAFAPGVYEVENVSGTTTNFEARRTTASTTPQEVNFQFAFNSRPGVIAQSQTNNGKADSIITRVDVASNEAFNVQVQEQESFNNYHRSEEVGYIASEVPSMGSLNSLGVSGDLVSEFETRRPTKEIADAPNQARRIPFVINNNEGFSRNPRVVTAMQTRRGPQPASLRRTELTRDYQDLFVQEEKSADQETVHAPEDVAFLAFGSDGLLPGRVATDIT